MSQGPWNNAYTPKHFNNTFQQNRASAFGNTNSSGIYKDRPGGQQSHQQGHNGHQSEFKPGFQPVYQPSFPLGSLGNPLPNAPSQFGSQQFQSAFQPSQPSTAFPFPAGQAQFNNSYSREIPAPSFMNQTADSASHAANQPVSSAFKSAFNHVSQPQLAQVSPVNPFQSGGTDRAPTSAFSAIPSGNAQQSRKEKKRNEPKFDRKEKRRETPKNSQTSSNRTSEVNGSRKADSDEMSNAKPITDLPRFPPGKFTGRVVPSQDTALILKPSPKPLISIEPGNDSWDLQNQEKLREIERKYLVGQKSLQSAYELMVQMRQTERLEMEKRGLVDSTEVRKNLTDAIQFVGSCSEMCPVFERVRRAYENNTFSLEKYGDGRVVKTLAVKAFSRPAAGQPPPLPSDVRPPTVLVSTLKYLVSHILPKLPSAHPFLWDRTRSIRQDFTYQNYQGDEALWCFEVIARIHCVSFHRMAKCLGSGDEWSQQQEIEQFNKCLQSLSEFYQSRPLVSSNEGEIRAYQLLSHFFDSELASTIDRLPVQTSKHPLVNLALELRSLAELSVTKFFHRIRKPDIPATFRAIAEIHFNKLRMRAIRQLLESMHKRVSMYSMARFVNLLGFESRAEANKFCAHFDLIISESTEAGEEVDIRSWDETNIRDKQPLAQAFDESLDSQICSLNVIEPLALGTVQTGWQAPFGSHAGLQNADQGDKQSFLAKSIASKFAQDQTVGAPNSWIHKSLDAADVAKGSAVEAEETQRQNEAFRREEQLQEQQRQREELEKAKQQKLSEEKVEAEARAKSVEQQKQLELAQRKKAELKLKQQKLLQERVDLRTQFVERAKNHLFTHLFDKVCRGDCDAIVRSINMNNRRILSKTVRAAKTNAQASLEKRKIQHIRAQELNMFRSSKSRKRVVSHRAKKKVRAVEPVSSPPSNVSSATHPPDESRHLSISPPVQSHSPLLRFDWKVLKTLLSNAQSFGLDRMYFASDWSSPHGKWLEYALRLDSSIVLEGGVEFKLLKYRTEEAVDVGLVETGYAREVHFSVLRWTASAKHSSLQELGEDIESGLKEYLNKMHDHLQRHKSLAIKRRRMSLLSRGSLNPSGPSEEVENCVTKLDSQPAILLRVQQLRRLVRESKRLAREL